MRGRVLRAVAAQAPEAPQPVFDLEDHIYYLFTQIFGRRNRHLAAKLRVFGITVPKWRVLAVLHERPGVTMNQLADLTTVDRTTLTRTLDQMERGGLIKRRADPADRRSVRLHLAPQGDQVFSRILPLVIEENERAARGIAAAELAQFRRTLHRMVRNLDPDYDTRNAAWLGAAAGARNQHRNKGGHS